MKRALILSLCVVVAPASLSGCGGGGDDNSTPPPTSQVPGGASASIGGFIDYLKALVVATSTDALEPVDVSAVTPPADDAVEPTPVD